LLSLASTTWSATTNETESLLLRVRSAFNSNNLSQALALCDQAVKLAPSDARLLGTRARIHEAAGNYDKAIADLSSMLKITPASPEGWQKRGELNFKASHFKESVADFDRFLELVPAQAPHHWQRGISLYYAGRFEDGRRQFESHQTVNPNDVENAVWHFLCVARQEGIEKARASLIKIGRDSRVPMMEVLELYRGTAKPEDVLAAAQRGTPSQNELRGRLFYAHLYLGLYYDATGDSVKAREHIFKAAGEFATDHYMGDVARVHAKRLKEAQK
jgi:lipoprotein NlpI